MPDDSTTTTTTTTTTARSIAGIWQLQHYLAFQEAGGTFGDNKRVTEDTSFELENDDKTYEPEYLDRKVQPVYTMSRKTTFNFEVDMVLPGEIQAALYAAVDELNVPVLYTQTLDVDPATGDACAATALIAKQAEGTLTMSPLKGEASNPIKLAGKVSLTSGWTYGTFNESTGEFTATA